MKTTPRAGPRLSLEACYRDLRGEGIERVAAAALLGRRHWLHDAAGFDQRTGEMLPGPLGQVCDDLRKAPPRPAGAGFKDRLYRIVEHVEGPLRDVLRGMNERLVRVHASLPIRAVRELDSACFSALSRRPGRTIREKLADRPYLLAVERRWTTDSSENRLVKALCTRLAHLLRVRPPSPAPGDGPSLDDFLALVEGWLLGPAAEDIGPWENVPPNNILLQHRDYRRLWDAWLWLQLLDEDLRRDQNEALAQWTTIVFWSVVSHLRWTGGVRLLSSPATPTTTRSRSSPRVGPPRGGSSSRA